MRMVAVRVTELPGWIFVVGTVDKAKTVKSLFTGNDQVRVLPLAGNTVDEIVQVAVLLPPAVVDAQLLVVVRLLKSVATLPLRPTCLVVDVSTVGVL